jgi:hypothetical protein
MRGKIMGIEAKSGDLLLSKPLFSPAHPISPFSRTAKQYFVDAVSMTPVIFVENTVASKQALSR